MSFTLQDLLKEKARDESGRGVTFIAANGQDVSYTYKELFHVALRTLTFLQSEGLRPGDELVFQISDNRNLVVVFWACILGGVIPVPLAIGQNEEQVLKMFNVWSILNRPRLITNEINLGMISAYADANNLGAVCADIVSRTIEENGILSCGHPGVVHGAEHNNIAFIQFSSGSTGQPKGVKLTHKNLITNMRDIGKAARYTSNDIALSWMPLTHDMGLIGFHLNPILFGMHHYLMPTNLFVRRPMLWLRKASQYRASVLCAPNFGYAYYLKHFSDEENQSLNLSSVRIIYNGAEPISEPLCNEFTRRLVRYGLSCTAMRPVYGLAEATLAVSMSKLDDLVLTSVPDIPSAASEGKSDSPSYVNVGQPVDHCSIRVTNENGDEISEGNIGCIEIKGDNVTQGYYNDHISTVQVLSSSGWLKTGDMGFLSKGSLYITGRQKDVFFWNGQNYYPQDIEQIAAGVEGVELNKIAIVGSFNETMSRDEVFAFVAHRGDLKQFVALARRLREVINNKTGIWLDKIFPVKEIPRTTSGKLRRFQLLEKYREGAFQHTEELVNQLNISEQKLPSLTESHDVEAKLLGILSKTLECNGIDPAQRFFDIGGNSLKAAEVCMHVAKAFNVNIEPEILFKDQSIAELAQAIVKQIPHQHTPIPVTTVKASYTASSPQRRVFYSWKLDRNSICQNIPIALKISGPLDIQKLEACIKGLIRRYDVLRCSFLENEPISFVVHDHVEFELAYRDCCQDEPSAVLRSLVKPFDLQRAPLFRIELLGIGSAEYVLFMDFHHIISDGISISVFLRELLELYNENILPDLPVQFKDYSEWEESQNMMVLPAAQQYWTEQLRRPLPVLDLPTDFVRPPLFIGVGGKIRFLLEPPVMERLRSLTLRENCSLHTLLLTLYQVLLTKITNQDEFFVGLPVSGRYHVDVLRVQGMFVNNIPLRCKLNSEASFTDNLRQSSIRIAAALKYQDCPFEELLSIARVTREASRNPVFDTMFVFQNMDAVRSSVDNIDISRYFFDPGFSKYDLSLEMFDDGEPAFYIEYASNLFEKDTILRFGEYFKRIIEQVLNNPNILLLDITLMTKDEMDNWIFHFNASAQEYPGQKTVSQLFRAQAITAPELTALEFEDSKMLSYAELNTLIREFALILRRKGVEQRTITAVLLPRSPLLVVSILSVLEAGGAYLPIDVNTPRERLSYLLKDSQCDFVISEPGFYESYDLSPSFEECHFSLSDLNPVLFRRNEIAKSVPDDGVAYVIYTSGTTGKPKGVVVSHRSLTNYITWAASTYVGEDSGAFPLFTSIAFDLTVTSIFVPLITGNKVVIYPEQDDVATIVQRVISEDRVDVIKATPSHLRIIAESALDNPRFQERILRFVVGGEKFDSQLAQSIYDSFNGHVKIFNEYGPTEATVGCMIYEFDPSATLTGTVPIGRPGQNTQIYLLDRYLKPVPVGVHGELFIAGYCLSNGYLFNEALTNERFIDNPYDPGTKMYTTGDIGKRLKDGNIDFVGRADSQIKINGYRIEPREIECELLDYDLLDEVVVCLSQSRISSEKYLSCYFVAKTRVNESELRQFLSERLPRYMIPVTFIQLEYMPLTSNGKVDHNALPVMDEPREYVGAYSEIESTLVDIWKDVFKSDDISVTDDFFELGGDSIKAVQITSRLHGRGLEVNARDILKYHTIRAIAPYATMTQVPQYDQGLTTGTKNLSPIETWFFQQKFINPNFYHQSLIFDFHKEIDFHVLRKCIELLVRHHDALRMNYRADEGKLFFNNDLLYADVPLRIVHYDPHTSSLPDLCQRLKREIDINSGYLFRVAIVKEDKHCDRLFITIHHLAIDGISWTILLRDLQWAYTAIEQDNVPHLPSKTATLLQWQVLMDQYAEILKDEIPYWNQVEESVFCLPVDAESDDWSTSGQKTKTILLEDELVNIFVSEAHASYRTDLLVVITTLLALSLREWTSHDQLVVEFENHGRHLEDIDVSNTVGWFTAMYPVKLALHGSSFSECIRGIKEQLRSIPNHGIGYGILKWIRSRNSHIVVPKKSEVRFNYLGEFTNDFVNDLFSYTTETTGYDTDPRNHMTSKLELNCMLLHGALRLDVNYNSRLFTPSTIDTFCAIFKDYAHQMREHLMSENDIHFTPSDFNAVDLDDDLLTSILK